MMADVAARNAYVRPLLTNDRITEPAYKYQKYIKYNFPVRPFHKFIKIQVILNQ
jgi:hypothetical protein